jgi:SagB-type dehydrogenase family enzyme
MGAASRGKRYRKREADTSPGRHAPASASAPSPIQPSIVQPLAVRPTPVQALPDSPAAAARARAAVAPSAAPAAEPWYVGEGQRGQRLLAAGDVVGATQVFENVLARLGAAPGYPRAVVLGQLGRCLHLGGRPEFAMARLREALQIAGALPPSAAVTELRGSLLSELGNALRAAGRTGEARQSYESALAVAEASSDVRARGVDLGHLGALALAEGRPQEARARYADAVLMFRQANEPALEALARQQLAAVLQHAGQLDDAERHYAEAARLREAHGDLAAAAQVWSALAALRHQAGDRRAAEAWYRKAIAAHLGQRSFVPLCRDLAELASLLHQPPGRFAEARELAMQALAIARQIDAAGAQVWRLHGVLAAIDDAEAAAPGTAEAQRAALRVRARDRRRLQEQAPRILAALDRLDAAPSFGRAAILGGLGRCFAAAGEPDLAVAHLKEAVDVCATLPAGDETHGLRGSLQAQLGEILATLGRHAEAARRLDDALALARESRDLRAEGLALCHLGGLEAAQGQPQEAQARYRTALGLFGRLRDPALQALAAHRLTALRSSQPASMQPAADPEVARRQGATTDSDVAAKDDVVNSACALSISVFDDVTVEYVFEPDLLLDGREEGQLMRLALPGDVLPDDVRPALIPGTRSYMDEEGAVRFCAGLSEPSLERQPGCVVMRRRRRQVAVVGRAGLVWKLVCAMDGECTAAALIGSLAPEERPDAARLLAALAAAGAVDVSGRPFGRYLHSATKKGVLPGGRLDNEDVLRLATDGNYRRYEGAARIALEKAIPERLRGFHALTRMRRSRRDYAGRAVRREDFDALLGTACGVTGAMSWAGREVKLRAYPSSGALYAVEVYPIVLRVEGLEPGIYHYLADDDALEVVSPRMDAGRMVAAALPVEREMVAGAAAMVCLVGRFPRHEHKYGEGGYRMMVAEAGHLSQTLVLAATALGLSARPFGGVFDDLVNEDLQLDPRQEQFLLAVLVGHAAGAAAPGGSGP